MDERVYRRMYDLEDHHWWFRGRRRVIWALLERAALPPAPRLLDAGCGTGRNLVEYGRLGPAEGVDPSPTAVAFCRRRGLDGVAQAGLEALPFEDGRFDVILACDVLEHVPDDRGALRELRRVAAGDARLVVTVPAYQWLWSRHDLDHHHLRRYTLGRLLGLLEAGGWRPVLSTYFNSVLLAPIAAARLASRRRGARGTDLDRGPAALNGVLERALRAEAWAIARGARLPAGVSAAAVCRPDEYWRLS